MGERLREARARGRVTPDEHAVGDLMRDAGAVRMNEDQRAELLRLRPERMEFRLSSSPLTLPPIDSYGGSVVMVDAEPLAESVSAAHSHGETHADGR
jgi:hypothetical protein